MRRPATLCAAAVAAVLTLTASACSTSPADGTGTNGAGTGPGRVIEVAASISAWGSILAQLGGAHVHETSIIANPDTDPHDYEPTPQDARVIATSRLFVENGVGYDPWAAKTLAASPSAGRRVLDVGRLVHVPAGGNPHRWYAPSDVHAVAAAITADLTTLDPPDAAYFAARHTQFVTTGLATYDTAIRDIRRAYAGVRIGASESIVAPLAQALRLDLVTPPTFLRAISEGTDPSPSDLRTIAAQLARKQISVYVYNRQNATPDVVRQVRAARAAGIEVCTVTETLTPARASFQQWQAAQLHALAAALHRATGR